MTEPTPGSTTKSYSRPIALLFGVIALGLAAWSIADRVAIRATLANEAAVAAVPVVITIKPLQSPASEDMTLPGSVQAFIEAPIYSRTNGYLKNWYTDIGAHVKKGQLLAEIDTPEIDQELAQGQADLATASANALLARTTDERWKGLLTTHSVSQQDADTKAGDAAAKQAAEKSASANVARLHELESFKHVVAPFDGIITQRNTDVGTLINAGESNGAALFRVADTHKLRVYVLVPELYIAAMTPGLGAELHFTEHPGQSYAAKIVRSANALDPALRTLQVELQVDNSKGALLPGAYTEVHFQIPGGAANLRLPVNTLLFRAAGLQVATIAPDNQIRLKNIVPGRDFGSSIEVLSGIAAEDEIVVNPPDSLVDGTQVHIVTASSHEKKPS